MTTWEVRESGVVRAYDFAGRKGRPPLRPRVVKSCAAQPTEERKYQGRRAPWAGLVLQPCLPPCLPRPSPEVCVDTEHPALDRKVVRARMMCRVLRHGPALGVFGQ